MRKVTIQDIARELGVSKGTVDRALHNRLDVSAETREKVLKLAEKYGYEPDRVARILSLRSKKIKIGVIIQNSPEFFWGVVNEGIRVAEAELADFGLQVILKPLHGERDIDELSSSIDELSGEKVDGIVLVPCNDPKLVDKINSTMDIGITVATINDDITGSKRVFYIGPQMRQSGRLAAEITGRFLQCGGKVLVIKGNTASYEYQERLEGFKSLLKEAFGSIELIAEYSFSPKMLEAEGASAVKSILESTGPVDLIYDVDGATLLDVGSIVKNSTLYGRTLVVGHEFSDNVGRLIQENAIHACISQDPYSQGYYSIRELFNYITVDKKPGAERVYTRLDIIMKENMQSCRNSKALSKLYSQ